MKKRILPIIAFLVSCFCNNITYAAGMTVTVPMPGTSSLPTTTVLPGSVADYLDLPDALIKFRENFAERLVEISSFELESSDPLAFASGGTSLYDISLFDPPYQSRCLYSFDDDTLDYYFYNVIAYFWPEAKQRLRDIYEQLSCVPAYRFNDIALAFYFADMDTARRLDETTTKQFRQVLAPLGYLMFDMGNELTRIILNGWMIRNQADWLAAIGDPASLLRDIGLGISVGPNLVFVSPSQARDILESLDSAAWNDGACAFTDMRYISDVSDPAVPDGMFCKNTCMNESITEGAADAEPALVAAFQHPEVQEMCTEIKSGRETMNSALAGPMGICAEELKEASGNSTLACFNEYKTERREFEAPFKPRWSTELTRNSCWVSNRRKPPIPYIKRVQRELDGLNNELNDLYSELGHEYINNRRLRAVHVSSDGETDFEGLSEDPLVFESTERLERLHFQILEKLRVFDFGVQEMGLVQEEHEQDQKPGTDSDEINCPPDSTNCEQCGVQDERMQNFTKCIMDGKDPNSGDPDESDLPGYGGVPDPTLANWDPWSGPGFTEHLKGFQECMMEVAEKDSDFCGLISECPEGKVLVDCQCVADGASEYDEQTLEDFKLEWCANYIGCSGDEDCSCGSLFDDDDIGGGEGPFPRPPVKRAYMH